MYMFQRVEAIPTYYIQAPWQLHIVVKNRKEFIYQELLNIKNYSVQSDFCYGHDVKPLK